ncbi:MAG TPA: hypothetical protein VD998_00980 [Verrucomicrobiae bacterium]|nr:hypothetical protein [Verrucomicrobiae bacterium]
MNKLCKFSLFSVVFVLFGNFIPLNYTLAAPHAPGTNVISNGTIYMIAEGQRRAYTSEAAFLSYGFNTWSGVVPANADDLALNEGNFIPPRDGKIVCSDRGNDKGTCYLISNGKRSAFVSAEVFRALGFSFGKALTGDVSFLQSDADISNGSEAHRPGVLINRNGTIYLVSSNGLMGIPNPDVLRSWGYSFADAILANTNDQSLQEYSVITTRQGAHLKPTDALALNNASEQIILRSYLDSYPALPTAEASSPEDVAAILILNNQLGPDASFKESYPYMSSASIQFINQLPTLKKAMEENEIDEVYNAEVVHSNVKVFEGRQKALLTETLRQPETNYSYPIEVVFTKENNIWKMDLIGTLKQGVNYYRMQNPNDIFTSGTGTTDISITGLEYETGDVILNDRNARFLVGVRNNGQSRIHKFITVIHINNTMVYAEEVNRQLEPGQEVVLSFPISTYWNPNIIRTSGEYRTDITVGFDPVSLDSNPNNNSYYTLTNFRN